MRTGQACSAHPVTVHLDDRVVTAALAMRERHVGCVVIVDERDRPVGLLSDRDIAITAVAQAAERLPDLLVRDVWSEGQLFVAHAEEPLWKTLKRMRDHAVRRLPVLDAADQLVGVVALDDVIILLSEQLADVASLIEDQPGREHRLRR